jgi:hypothetical protein
MVRKQDRQLETDIRATKLTRACFDAGLRSPIRFRAENQKEPTELLWSHKDGRLSVYVHPGGGFSIEDIPYNDVQAENIQTIDEVVEILSPHSFLWDYSHGGSRSTKGSPTDSTEELDEDGFPTV